MKTRRTPLDTLFTANIALLSFAAANPTLPHLSDVLTLYAIEQLTSFPGLPPTYYGVIWFLNANHRAPGKGDLVRKLERLTSSGHLTLKSHRYTLTAIGTNALQEFNGLLTTTHFKYRRTDTGLKPSKAIVKKRAPRKKK